jgi:hypothetical protein
LLKKLSVILIDISLCVKYYIFMLQDDCQVILWEHL